ncbi:hypothetical protein Salat_1686000 [Sesamum alatum]|uniref:Uncharacterized protein n=1 Tax=Sesamum alatum TaxID=300844 RepID=A0AAE2CK59_9LAMI|nr:hypothetical protein Salat_1686000 [Sesamum alatum]
MGVTGPRCGMRPRAKLMMTIDLWESNLLRGVGVKGRPRGAEWIGTFPMKNSDFPAKGGGDDNAAMYGGGAGCLDSKLATPKSDLQPARGGGARLRASKYDPPSMAVAAAAMAGAEAEKSRSDLS